MQVIGIDIGTTSICGVAIDCLKGKVLRSKTINSEAFIKTDNSYEKIQDPEKIIKIATEILNEFITEDTISIGVTGQMHGIVYTDKSGKAISPLYTWQDERGNLLFKNTTYAKFLNSFSGYGNVTDFYNRNNGLRKKEAINFCTIHDYFVMSLTGLKTPLIHSTDAASFGLYDLKENKFNFADYKNNAEITTDFKIAGKYKNIPVAVAIGDNQASVFSCLRNDEDILINVGTGSQISVISNNIINKENIEIRPYFNNKFLLVGAALCGGRAFSMLKDFYYNIIKLACPIKENEIYPIIDKMLLSNNEELSIKVDTRFAGTRQDPKISGSINKITTDNFTPLNLTLGFLDGMVTELYNLYKEIDIKKTGLVGSGNGVRKNKPFVNFAEKHFNTKMKIPKHNEEAAFGAALFSLIAAKAFNINEVQDLIKYN